MATQPEFRKSQGIVPFGVGATIDFENESLMSAGLDVWPFEKASGEARSMILNACQVVDGRLARRLSAELERKIEFFLSPTEAPERGGFGLQCSNAGRRVEGKGEPCASLTKRRRPPLSPVRFVVACENGHIMDFPWSRWAHRKSDKHCDGKGDLYLYSTPAAGLAGVVVECVECGARRSMAGAFQKDILREFYGSGCPGERPWLGPSHSEECQGHLIPQTIQRGASNAYFAKVVSSILIPPYSARVQQALDRPDIWAEIEAIPYVDGGPFEAFLRVKAKNLGLDADAFIRAVAERLSAADSSSHSVAGETPSEERYRYDEYKAYTGPRPPKQERDDFDTESLAVSTYPDWFGGVFGKVVLVKKLRETRVLTGFSRLVPVEATRGPKAALSVRPKPWLPGFSVRGEGIFLQFNEDTLQGWASRHEEVHRRVSILQARLDSLRAERELSKRVITPELVLIHTFSHLLIRQLAFECGYDTSSIRERIYASSTPGMSMSGLLLYTASGDSEGTLGGLVRQGEPGNLECTIKAALANASICSSDPLCIESEGQGTYTLNLAACHACGLLPETSCEEGNLLLDRVLVLGTPGKVSIGYFSDLLA
jgi:hypothetical protein